MPSDTSGRYPIGVLTRPAPDFFDDNIASGGINFPQAGGPTLNNYITVGLFNNDSLGRNLKVYGISIASDGGGGFGFFYTTGPLGAFDSNCQPINPLLGALPGQIYQQHMNGVTDRPNDFYTGPFINIIGSDGFDSSTVVSPFPLFIVPAGYSLVGTNLVQSSTTACYYWYQVANE